MTITRILVTGSSGCLGFPLARALVAEGRTVVGLDIAPPHMSGGYTHLTGDVGDPHLVHRLFAQHRFEGVVHCGGISGQMVAPDDPYREGHVNIVGTMNLLEAARQHGVTRLVYCSSQAAYGAATSANVTEDEAFRPLTVYGATKAACDALARAYRVQHGVETTTLRIGRVYGPGRRTESVIHAMLQAAVAKRRLVLPASRGQSIQYVYDADIVSALHAALLAGKLAQPAYNVSGPGSATVEEIAAMIRTHVPQADIVFEPGARAAGTHLAAMLDYSAAVRDFGYAPRYDLATGIAAYLAWMRESAQA
jgi:nucleoside-diphosphate-sugar epimerase